MTTRMNTSLAVKFLMATAIASYTLTGSSALASENCKKVYLKVVNKTGKRIKIIDLDYYDSSSKKWRSEPVPNEVIPKGQVWQETRQLEKVNAEKTRIRVEYRKPKSGGTGKWGKKIRKSSSSKICHKGSVFEVVLR